MDEPTHANESQFWDQIADWLLAPPSREAGPLNEEDMHLPLRQRKDGES